MVITRIISEDIANVDLDNLSKLSKIEVDKLVSSLEKQMKEAAKELDFEQAMGLRDIIFELKSSK